MITEIPTSWTCDSDGKGVKVEVYDPQHFDQWVEIPTTNVELYVNKSGVADIQRTAKVEFPTEWDGQPVIDLIQGFRPEAEGAFSFARISFREGFTTDNPWEVVHFGFVGGTIGKSGEPGVSRMWVYDMADLMGGMPVGVTFENILPSDVMGRVADRVNDTLPAYVTVDTEILEAFLAPFVTTGPDGQEIPRPVAEQLPSKTFQNNRDTLLDIMTWVSSQTSANWYFAPHEDGVTLTLDADPQLTLFQQEELAETEEERRHRLDLEPWEETPEATIENVDIIDNEALFDIQPVNTVIVRGETDASSVQGEGVFEKVEDYIGDKLVPSREFPVVKVRAQNIYDRQGIELAPPIVESDDITISGAIQTAYAVLNEELSQPAEGEIIMYGEPTIAPDALIDALPTCNGKIESTEVPPIRYQVEEVKHIKKAGQPYKTEIRVSAFAKDIAIIEARMEELENAEEFDPLLTPIGPITAGPV